MDVLQALQFGSSPIEGVETTVGFCHNRAIDVDGNNNSNNINEPNSDVAFRIRSGTSVTSDNWKSLSSKIQMISFCC